jgi:pimeloyl-ACP methyl ester carboxylesterase
VPSSYRDHYVQSHDGLALYARDYARAGVSAPAVLCLPGLTRNSADFEDLAQHLAPRFRVIAPDLRGRGRSARDAKIENYQPVAYLADLAILLASLDVSRFAVIGTSLGGLLAMMLAAAQPAKIAGIVLNDIGPEVDPVGAARIRAYAGRLPAVAGWSDAVAQLQEVFGAAWPGLPAERWPLLARRCYRADPDGTLRMDADPLIGEAMRAAPVTTPAPDLWPLWRALKTMPVLCLRGAHSDILSAATLVRMQHEKPDLATLTVANRGHVPLLDEPGCLAAIDAFLARVFP